MGLNRTIVFDEDIKLESVCDLITSIEEGLKEGKVTIYFKSGGGKVDMYYILIDFLNKYRDKIELVANCFIGSCAFDVFMDFLGEKRLLDCYGMVHLRDNEFSNRELCKSNSFTKLLSVGLEENNKKQIKKYNFLSEEEIALFSAGEDIFLTPQRMNQIFQC